MKKLAIAAVAALAMTGCATQTYVLTDNAAQTPSADKWQHFFVGGIGQEVTENAAQVCGGAHKVAKIQTKESGLNVLAHAVAGIIYTPRQNLVYCK